MTIKVEAVWNGHWNGFELTMPTGEKETIRAYEWSKPTKHRALNLCENVYGYTRRNIRFDVR